MPQELQITETPVDGEIITLAGQELTLPPLPLTRLSKMGVLLSGGNPMEDEYVNAMVDATFYSLKRNYKEITREFVEDNLDLRNFAHVLQQFMTVNKLEVTSAGKPQAEQEPITKT